MKIIKDPKFNEEFKVILRFIALDSKAKAINFKNELISKVNDLPYIPYKYRKSHYFSDDNIRDYIFKGYVIPYSIDIDNNTLSILGIVKYKEVFL
jgi:hypothetical protein